MHAGARRLEFYTLPNTATQASTPFPNAQNTFPASAIHLPGQCSTPSKYSLPSDTKATYDIPPPTITPNKAHPYGLAEATGPKPELTATMGTSFAAPFALRTAVGVRAVLGETVHPLTIKALIIHAAQNDSADLITEVGWGRIPHDLNDIIMCGDGIASIIYQGLLRPG